MQLFKRKAMLGQLPAAALVLVVASISIGIGAWVLAKIKAVSDNADVNTTITHGTSAMTNLAQWLPIIAIVIAAVVILALIMRGFGQGRAT